MTLNIYGCLFLFPIIKAQKDIFFSDKFSSNVAIKEVSNIKF